MSYYIRILLIYLSDIDRMKALPPWRGLHHFDQVMSVQFSDANKFRDILKVRYFMFKSSQFDCLSLHTSYQLDVDFYKSQCSYRKR
jgi:hypothetical protein